MKTQPPTSESRLIAALHLARIAMAAAVDTAANEIPKRVGARRMDQMLRLQRQLHLLERHAIEGIPGAGNLLKVTEEGIEAFARQRFGAPLNLHSWIGAILVQDPTLVPGGRVLIIIPTVPEGGQ